MNKPWLPDSFIGMRCNVYLHVSGQQNMGMKITFSGNDEMFLSLLCPRGDMHSAYLTGTTEK